MKGQSLFSQKMSSAEFNSLGRQQTVTMFLIFPRKKGFNILSKSSPLEMAKPVFSEKYFKI